MVNLQYAIRTLMGIIKFVSGLNSDLEKELAFEEFLR
jgi:hypothetical protein